MSVHARSGGVRSGPMAHAFKDHGYDVDRFKLDPDLLKTHEGHYDHGLHENAWSVVGSRPQNPTAGRSS